MDAPVTVVDSRLAALHSYELLDTPREPAFDDLARLAQELCGTRFAVVNLIDSDRQWFKSEIGFGIREMPLDDSICARVMFQPDLVEIPDLQLDARFRCNPLITAGPQLRFYAGAPLINGDGHVLGTLCVLDTVPMRLTESQRRGLAALGRQVVSQMELWRNSRLNARQAAVLATTLEERDRAQDELLAREAAYRFVIEHVLAGLVVHDRQGAVTIANAAASTLLGLSRDQLQGRMPTDPAWHFIREDGTVMPLEDYPISIVARTRAPLQDYVVGVIHGAGREPVWALVNAYPELDHDGTVARTVVSFVDISQRKRIEQQLREASHDALHSARLIDIERSRLDALLDAAPVGIFYCDASGRLLLANAFSRDIWGVHPVPEGMDEYAEWRGWWADGSARHGQPVAPEEWPVARLLRGEADSVLSDVVEIEPFDRPGQRRTLLLRAERVRDSDGRVNGAVLVQLDITEQVHAQAALRESEARFRTITNAVPHMVWSTLHDGTSDYFSRQWYAFTGTEEGTSDGMGWLELVHADDRETVREVWQRSTREGTHYEVEYRLLHHSGVHRWVLARGVPLYGDAGTIERWMGTCTDIHDLKLARSALERSEEALRLADRRKDEFLAMLAHELRNPLAPISTASELLRHAAGDEARVRMTGEIISRQVRHMTSLVDDLLDVSRVTRGLIQLDRSVFDLRTAVRAAVEQVWPMIETRRHSLTTRTGGTPMWVYGDATRITQVIANLLNNAAKYTPPEGEITLTAASHEGQVRVTVEDSGQGIDASLLPHVFELFTQADRSMDRSQGGLGIGLALVRSLVELHGGGVSAYSEGGGHGSRFEIRLPQAAALAPGPEPIDPADTGVVEASGLDIVVVDDNQDAGQTLATLLEIHGHRVRAVGTAREAIELDSAGVGVFILDIGLPDMSGYELARVLRSRHPQPGLRLFALTGYGQAHDRQASENAGFDRHFVKPLDPAVLLEVLAEKPVRT